MVDGKADGRAMVDGWAKDDDCSRGNYQRDAPERTQDGRVLGERKREREKEKKEECNYSMIVLETETWAERKSYRITHHLVACPMHGKQSRENRWNGVGSLQLEPSELDDERDENTAEHWNWTLRRVARRGECERGWGAGIEDHEDLKRTRRPGTFLAMPQIYGSSTTETSRSHSKTTLATFPWLIQAIRFGRGVGGKWYLDGTRFSRPVYARLRGTEQVPFPKNPPPRPIDSGGEQRGASQSECLERRLGFELAAVIGWI
ncbi:uncharacterized protein CIMG_11170 [Coccidioides immitis RS]|uniref:Uncharacterized protein n=1 Tax=Coccidioides immitis (strain RS) TaxID=246410 RepID=A0A0D8JZ49_COCIM|nr:uncharacterized protein CIMG_11170 [Coccidioides immitis RS]KJF61543.1 hypothetical protein CIMG_11170 [Coccidioides immitis RS]